MKTKIEKFRSRFLQESLVQSLTTRGEYEMLFNAFEETEIDKLIEGNVFFSRTCSPSAIMELQNVPASDIMRLVTFEANYQKLFLPEEVVGILLHEIGHAFNSNIKGMTGEYMADNFAKTKGYAKWIVSGLKNGLKRGLIGFEKVSIDQRIEKLNEVKS